MEKINGRSVVLSLTDHNGDMRNVMACRSTNWTMSADLIAVCSPTDGKWSKYKMKKCEASMSCGCLIAEPMYVDEIERAIASGYEMQFRLSIGNDCYRSGKCVAESESVNGEVGSLAGFSCDFRVSGPVSHVHIFRDLRYWSVPGVGVTESGMTTTGNGVRIYSLRDVGKYRIYAEPNRGWAYIPNRVINKIITDLVASADTQGLIALGAVFTDGGDSFAPGDDCLIIVNEGDPIREVEGSYQL